jgi:hypothetical protein
MVQSARKEFNRELCEFDAAHGFTPVVNQHSWMHDVRSRGKDLNAKIYRDGRSRSSQTSTSHMSTRRPKYSLPLKNLRATTAEGGELSLLSGEALLRQQA